MKKARTMSEERREENCSLAAASLLLVVIAVGGNSFERRDDLVSIKEKRAYLKVPRLRLRVDREEWQNSWPYETRAAVSSSAFWHSVF